MLKSELPNDVLQLRQLTYKCGNCQKLTFIDNPGLPIPYRVYCAWCGNKEAELQ